MFTSNPNTDPAHEVKDPSSMKTKIIVGVLGLLAILGSYFLGEYIKDVRANPQQQSIDSRMKTLESLRSEKKENEKKIEELKAKNYILDQKIIPLKCGVYSEVGAKDTWESECRDSHEEQKQKILNQESDQVDEAVVPEYQ